MFPKFLSHDGYRAQRSSALVITLAAVVLVSAIILVFFGQSTLHRQMSFASAGQDRADLTAHMAMDTIVGDLRNEIAAGSTVTTTSGTNIYVPTANTTVVPYQVSNQSYANLIKESAQGWNFWSGANYTTNGPIRSAGNNSSTNVSWNGRAISLAEWNRPGLLVNRGSGPNPAAVYYYPPDWVIVTRQGPVATPVPAVATMANKSPGNMNYAIGRYAYNIYDEGGLLDVNVAGYPSSISATDPFVTKRGVLPQVNLANIPGVLNANALVQWRNAASAATNTTYTSYVLGNTNGFTTVASGDQTFISRQDLIKYALANSNNTTFDSTLQALQYLGTFSRELNAPSYTPSSTLPAADRTSPSPNLSLINTPVTTPFTAATPRYSDNTTAQADEPLIKYRFPLSRLGWLSYQGLTGISSGAINPRGTAVTATDIYNAFGLTINSTTTPVSWTYNHGVAGTIMSLSAVATAGREPDFFELLQAGILTGSLGQTATNSYANTISYDANTSLQIIQIGANLIDQYDTDSFPTRITLSVNGSATEVDGIENLPYLASVYATPYRPKSSQPITVGMWLQPQIWNPHAGSPPTGGGPTSFFFTATGSTSFVLTGPSSPPVTNTPPSTPSAGIQFSTTNSTFVEPTLLSANNATASGLDSVSDGATNFVGICIGTATAPDTNAVPAPTPPVTTSYTNAVFYPSTNTFEVGYYYGTNSAPYVYSQMKSIGTNVLSVSDSHAFQIYSPQVCVTRSDPRTDRFGVVASSATPPNTNLWPVPPTTIYATSGYTTSGQTTWSGTGSVGTLSENKSSASVPPSTSPSPTYYTDPDGILRPADGAYTDGTAGDGGYPLPTGATASRPYVLNRPFQSVAEMGYAFRDGPWKHLDFFTTGSADAALLDLFCLNESPPPLNPSVSTAPIPEAGRVDLNTRQQAVLKAVLQGALMAEDDSATLAGGTSGEATTLASSLTNMTTTTPLLNRSELVTRWISAVPTATFDSNADAIIKRRREAAVRALADVGNTRTWNLLIDVIAQSGRYAPTAANYNQFIVEGERRYWLHVAIDRYTNKVVAEYLEPVYE